MDRIVAVTMLVALGSFRAYAQAGLHLKANVGNESKAGRAAAGSEGLERRHRVIQFEEAPALGVIGLLEQRGARVLQYVPDNGLLVNSPSNLDLEGLGARVLFADALTADQKWSPDLDPVSGELYKEGSERPDPATGVRRFVVEFYPDVDSATLRQVVTQHGLQLREHADLAAQHLLVEGTREQARQMAESDEVAYVFPPSPDLERGAAVHNCAGAVTQYGMVGQYVAKIGDGWDGPGKNAARLTYLIENATARLPPDAAGAEIRRALAEWSKHVQVEFNAGGRASDRGHIDIRFARGSHGDPFPFDGAGRVLAHTFYPAPPNPEPIAGDLHLDDDESWRIGTDVDLFSVVLHELGHALGLGHSDRPGTVMYAYYRRAEGLTAEDIAAVRDLYATRGTTAAGGDPPAPTPQPTPPPAPTPAPPPQPAPAPAPAADRTPPALTIISPSSTSYVTSAAAITVRGSAADNVGVARVTWNSNVAGSGNAVGTSEWSAEIPLARGTNYLTFRAWDAASNTTWRSLVVTRR